MIEENIKILKDEIKKSAGGSLKIGGRGLIIHLGKNIVDENPKLTLKTDESYILQISELSDGRVKFCFQYFFFLVHYFSLSKKTHGVYFILSFVDKRVDRC